MQDDQSNATSIAKLKLEYEKADLLAQEVEKFRREAGVAAINELRYAGYHLLQYVSSDTPDEAEITSAINHARRAAYEASEAGILAALKLIRQFQKDYSRVVIEPHVKDWSTKLRRCDEIMGLINKKRTPGDDRANDHEAAMIAFRELKDIAEQTSYARPELNKVIKQQKRSGTVAIYSLIAAFFAIAVSLVLFVLPYYIGTP